MTRDKSAIRAEKVRRVQSAFRPAIGSRLLSYTTAEVRFPECAWDGWPEMSIRFDWGQDRVIAVSWSQFEDLWLGEGESLPFGLSGAEVRWIPNSISALNGALGGTLEGVLLGRGEMSISGVEVEIWSRLLIRTSRGWVEVYNALDENGYDYHTEKPPGEFVTCLTT